MIEILASAMAAILQHAREVLPEECCGALIGGGGGGGGGDAGKCILESVPLTNMATDRRTRYSADSRGILRADIDARKRALDVIGFYHSHPEGQGRPSREDVRLAWDGYIYVIVEFHAGGEGKLRGWQYKEGTAEEVAIVVRQ